eukprot:NODE_1078_length_1403_cov_0.666411.p1 type:complete len:361 gc:universal NODE_1078_length_1403_cov_0.666411:59-1141(+)
MKISKERYDRSISRAKRKIYPRRKDWVRLGLKNYDFEFWKAGNIHTYQMGKFNYEIPCVLKLNWHCYTPYELLKRFAQQQVQVGDDDESKAVYMRFKYFMHYCATEAKEEDSPLYMFDEHFRTTASKINMNGGDTTVECIGDSSMNLSDCTGIESLNRIELEYNIPEFFSHDFLDLVGNSRPPNRWICCGPARSGTTLHQDPLGTAAWNMLMHGRKRWVLFPPETPKEVVIPFYAEQASRWFSEVYPTLNNVHKVEFVQHPGDCIYVPSNWYHAVINLDFTIAITHNFCSLSNFEICYRECKWCRPNMAKRLRNEIVNNTPKVQELCKYYSTTQHDLLTSVRIVDYMPQHELSDTPSDSE